MTALKIDPSDVTVVVRTVGERTTNACRRLLEAQVPPAQVFEVSGRPFALTLRKALKLGMREGRPWTLCVDADVLPASDAVESLLKAAALLPDAFLGLEGMVWDKFFGGARLAGNHLYRTCWLAEALAVLDGTVTAIRPEATMIQRLSDGAHPWRQIPDIFGLHDFEQEAKDIFRTSYIHAHKHVEYMPSLLSHWRREAFGDDDFKVALFGLAAGVAHCGPARVDAADASLATAWANAFALGLAKEREPFVIPLPGEVDRRLSGLVEAPEFAGLFEPPSGVSTRNSWWARYRKLQDKLGAVPAVFWMSGSVIIRAGGWLRRLADPQSKAP